MAFWWTVAMAAAAPAFDVPEATETGDLGPSALGEGAITRTCSVFREIAVVEQSDPGLKGTVLQIRARPPGLSPEEVCAGTSERGHLVPEPESVFYGAFGPYVYVAGADLFGNQRTLAVYSAITGDRLFDGIVDTSRPFVLTETGFAYTAGLATRCPLAEDARCWATILAENGVPASLGLRRPDCGPSYRMHGSPLDNPPQISVPAEVVDLEHAGISVRRGPVRCTPAP